MKKIILYSILSFESLIVWMTIYHAELTSTTNFIGSLETIRELFKYGSMFLFVIFTCFLAYECLKKEKR